MILVVGGQAQGKRRYVEEAFGLLPGQIADGAACSLDMIPDQPALDRLHLLVRRLLEAGVEPDTYLRGYLEQVPDAILIADEIGGGVVPVAAEERRWREETGRLCCRLAQRALRVDRVCCGIPMTIKGGAKC